MAEYIEREVAKKEINLNFGGVSHAVIANRLLDAIPAADVVTVVHGRWIEHEIPDEPCYGTDYECSVCGTFHHNNWNYCPVCGADMRERKGGDG